MIALLLLLALIALLLAILATLIKGYLAFYYRRGPMQALLLLVGCIVAVYVVFKYWETQRKLNAVPTALQVNEMIYNKESSWHSEFDETRGSFRVFVLPEKVANTIAAKGQGFFEDGELGDFKGWRSSPVLPDDAWLVDTSDWSPVPRHDGVLGFLCHYGLAFCIRPDSSVVDEANAIAYSPGSYYAYDGKGALIFVSSGKKRVIYITQ